MVFLSGPRQTGKTWLARKLMHSFPESLYLNWDNKQDRELMEEQAWSSRTRLIVFDEIHKMPQWKNYLKGIWDTRPSDLSVLVTGSARLETFRQSGDSLAGRYYHHRLFPFTPAEVAEMAEHGSNYDLDHYLERGGFPEPFLAESDTESHRWRRQYLDGLIREDILNYENIQQLKAMNLLVDLLRQRVASPLSYQSLSEDIALSPNTVKHYINILEALYIVFRVYPYHKSIARSLKQQAKLYFFDTALVEGKAQRLENMVALSLFRQLCLLQDNDGQRRSLCYLKTKEGREVDLLLVKESIPELMLEVKTSDRSLDDNLVYFHSRYGFNGIQLVADLRLEKSSGPLQVRRLLDYLQKEDN
ncbi:ATP-binding protein [Spirochaeta dissipatitropha]